MLVALSLNKMQYREPRSDRERYAEFLRSGPLKRVYVDLPEKAHKKLSDLAHEKGIPMKAVLTLLIADATAKSKQVSKKKPSTRRKKSGRKKTKKQSK